MQIPLLDRWARASQQVARRNAMIASTRLTQRRMEREEVDRYLVAQMRAAQMRAAQMRAAQMRVDRAGAGAELPSGRVVAGR